jgi:hypothetical protein
MFNARKFKILTTTIALLVVAIILPSDAFAQKKKSKKKSKKSSALTIATNFKITYDDNIINYSDDDLDLYIGGDNQSKFSIDSKDDWIFAVGLQPRLKGKFIWGHTAWLQLDFDYLYYAKNDVKRYFKLGALARHYLFKAAYVEIEYSYIPDYYYRNQYVQDLNTYIEASFSKNYLKAEIGYNIFSSLKVDVSYRYSTKAFNDEVSERNLVSHKLRTDLIWNPSKTVKYWVNYGFDDANADGADIEDLEIKDVSYDAGDMTFGLRYYTSKPKSIKPEYVGSFQYRKIRYQTDKYTDIYRAGREDDNIQLRFGTVWSMPYKLRLAIDYYYQMKRADTPLADVENLLDYNSNSISLNFTRSF